MKTVSSKSIWGRMDRGIDRSFFHPQREIHRKSLDHFASTHHNSGFEIKLEIMKVQVFILNVFLFQ